MNILQMLTELRAQRDRLVEAIAALERLALGGGKPRRGRPPAWMAEAKKGGK